MEDEPSAKLQDVEEHERSADDDYHAKSAQPVAAENDAKMKASDAELAMRRGYSLQNGVLKIAGRVVARDVRHVKRIHDRRTNRNRIAALISYDTMDSRNIVAFTLTGGRVWQIAEPIDAPRSERVFVGLHGSALRPIATTYGGWVYDIKGSDGSLWYLKWVK